MVSPLTDEYRRTSYAISQAIAPGWERRRAQFEVAVAPVREWMVRELGGAPAATVLEIAGGAGDTGFDVARALGTGGRLISTDFSPAMVDVARRRAAERGVGNAEFRVMDAERLDVATGSVDRVVCRFGYMLMADPAAALSETPRVLRPGGRLALAVWAAPERNPFFTVLGSALAAGGHLPAPREGTPNPFDMASPGRTTALLEGAGFGEVTVAEVGVEFRFPDVDGYLDFMADTAGPLAVVVQGLADADRAALASTLEGALRAFESDGEYRVGGAALVAAGS